MFLERRARCYAARGDSLIGLVFWRRSGIKIERCLEQRSKKLG
jgi:hypothetical protein